MAGLKEAVIPQPSTTRFRCTYRRFMKEPVDFPITEDFSAMVFALSMYPNLKEDEIEYICWVILWV
jgi:UDP-2-acetamido-2-deoxy-ribo-hexuluronate aminotransferase